MTFKLSYIYSALYYTLYIYIDIYTTSFQPHFNAQTACHPVKGCKSATEVRRLKMPRRNPCFFGSSGFALAVPVNSLEATLSNRNFQRAVEDKKRWKIVMLHNYRGSPTQGHTIAWKHLYETRRLERLHSPSCRHQNLFQPNSARVRYRLPILNTNYPSSPFQLLPWDQIGLLRSGPQSFKPAAIDVYNAAGHADLREKRPAHQECGRTDCRTSRKLWNVSSIYMRIRSNTDMLQRYRTGVQSRSG